MSDYSSDDFPGLDLSEFTTEDFAHIDANLVSLSRPSNEETVSAEPSFESEIMKGTSSPSVYLGEDTLSNTDNEIENLPGIDGVYTDTSFRSDTFDLNLSSLTAEELARLDNQPEKERKKNGSPSIPIEIEGLLDESKPSNNTAGGSIHTIDSGKPWLPNSPLDQFRSYMTLSVTDLVAPAWCEVQYDYGLRGKRSRPISQRPKSFVSSSGKIISPEINIVKKNDVQTRQGLAVHKELEREIKFEELEVEITTDETRWALRLVNMLACLKSMIGGFTREMPVFGVIHDEVVVGIMDEVIKEEILYSAHDAKYTKSAKRPSNKSQSSSGTKKARTTSPSPQTRIDTFFESPKKAAKRTDSQSDEENNSEPPKTLGYILHIKDNKTRKNHYIPSDPDMQSGRLQLMLYRRLLSELLSTNPPYDFTSIWRRVDVDSTAIFPTKFLVQAHLIEDFSGFQSTCLDDLVALWHSEVKELNILGVDPTLELVYRLRPPPGSEGKGNLGERKGSKIISDEERDLAMAIAASLAPQVPNPVNEVDSTHLTSSTSLDSTVAAVQDEKEPPVFDTEDMELQWAIRESTTPQHSPIPREIPEPPISEPGVHVATKGKYEKKGKGKEKATSQEEEGIRRFKIIGTKKFVHDDEELDKYLDHVLEWWRGERRPEGVPLERVYRCSYCEYENDCEWRAQKALELSKKKRPVMH